jgi:hypothetical protein
MALTVAQGREFRPRWSEVNRAERLELQRSKPTQRLRQLAALMASASAVPGRRALDAEDAAVWRRWQSLRAALRAR